MVMQPGAGQSVGKAEPAFFQKTATTTSTAGSKRPVAATPSEHGWLLPTSGILAITFGLICYALASSRPRADTPIAFHRDEEEDSPEEELLPYEDKTCTSVEPAIAVPAHQSEITPHRRLLCVLFLCLQYSTYALLRRFATGILHEDWSFSSVLGVGEMMKFTLSLSMIAREPEASKSPQGPLRKRVYYLILNSGKMAVPAGLYLAMNMLGFVR